MEFLVRFVRNVLDRLKGYPKPAAPIMPAPVIEKKKVASPPIIERQILRRATQRIPIPSVPSTPVSTGPLQQHILLNQLITEQRILMQIIIAVGSGGTTSSTVEGVAVIGDGGIIPHGLSEVPTMVWLQGTVPGQTLTWTADATNIYVAIKTNLLESGDEQPVSYRARP